MQRMGWVVVLGALMALACGQNSVEPEYEVTVMMLPEGVPDAGREAFITLGCTSCHKVAWDEDLPQPTSVTPGPELGLDATQPGPGGLATSVVAPSHKVPEGFRKDAEGKDSPMPDYTRMMTVRQLADIVAYLQRQGLETKAKMGQSGPG